MPGSAAVSGVHSGAAGAACAGSGVDTALANEVETRNAAHDCYCGAGVADAGVAGDAVRGDGDAVGDAADVVGVRAPALGGMVAGGHDEVHYQPPWMPRAPTHLGGDHNLHLVVVLDQGRSIQLARLHHLRLQWRHRHLGAKALQWH